MLSRLKRYFEQMDWQTIFERLNPERITNNPKFQKFVENLNLPDYVKGPESETEFLPAALEIVETPPSPAARVIAKIIMAFFVVAFLWACFGSVDIIATATGKVVPTGYTKVIQPMETGVVRAIHVQDGQSVKAGDVLVEIDPTINEAERDRLQKEYVETQLTVERLKAALNIDANPPPELSVPEGAVEAQIAIEKTFLTNQLDEIHSKLHSLDHQIAQQQGNQAAVQATIKKLSESIPYLQKRAEARDYLAQKGYGSKLDYLSAQQDLVEHQQEFQVQKGRLAEASATVASLQEQRKEAESEYNRKTLDDLAQAEQKASSLKAQWVEASEKYRLQTLTAPVDGTVQQLAVHTEGGVVTPAQVLMSVVPADSHIEIEATISNRDIGFVHAGQKVAVKVDTFNFTKYGLLYGHVLTVSQDAIQHDISSNRETNKQQAGSESETSEPKGQELVYAARVVLDQTQMEIDDKLVNLVPGMAVTVEIKTGSRHIISYLLSPIQKHTEQALHER